MTYFYYQASRNANHVPKETLEAWEAYAKKSNWRIVQLPNGYYQTEFSIDNEDWDAVTRRETIKGAEQAIDASIEHYNKKLKLAEGPVVVKTFK